MIKNIYIEIDDKESGPFSVEEVNEQLSIEKLSLSDIAWSKGMKEWLPLGDEGFLAMGIEKVLLAADVGSSDRLETDPGSSVKIMVLVDDQDVGPLSVDEVNRNLKDGDVQIDNLAWFKVLDDCVPLSSDEFVEIGVKKDPIKLDQVATQEDTGVQPSRKATRTSVDKDNNNPEGTKSPKPSKTPKFAKAEEVVGSQEFSDPDEVKNEKFSTDLKIFKIYQKNWLFYSVGFLLSFFPVFLFNYIALILKHLRSGGDLNIREVVSFDDWKKKLIFAIIFALCTTISIAALVVPGILFLSIFVYSIHVFSENKSGFKEALSDSKNLTEGKVARNAILIICIILLMSLPAILPIVGKFIRIPFLGLILAPIGLLNFLIIPLIHIYLCKSYISLCKDSHPSDGDRVSKLEQKGSDGIVAKGISRALEEIESFRPILNQCGFIIGNIKIETALAIPPVANVGFSIEQKSDSKSDLTSIENLPNMSKIQKSIVSSLKMILKLDDVVAAHNMTIGIFEIKVGTKPGFEVNLYSAGSRAFNTNA